MKWLFNLSQRGLALKQFISWVRTSTNTLYEPHLIRVSQRQIRIRDDFVNTRATPNPLIYSNLI